VSTLEQAVTHILWEDNWSAQNMFNFKIQGQSNVENSLQSADNLYQNYRVPWNVVP